MNHDELLGSGIGTFQVGALTPPPHLTRTHGHGLSGLLSLLPAGGCGQVFGHVFGFEPL
jgi:hypothetical protein